jgi:hypothetical protein
MPWDWCKQCEGEMVSCECGEPEDYAGEDYSPEEYLCEDIDDRFVVWTVNDSGFGRVEVIQ